MRHLGDATTVLSDDAVTRLVTDAITELDVDGAAVCVVVPDATRVCPLPLLFGAVVDALAGRVRKLTALVALGTHAPMSDDALAALLGTDETALAGRFTHAAVLNHRWDDPATFTTLGTIPAAVISELSDGMLAVDVPVRINRAVIEHDLVLIVGPVLPHEVVGFSGGNKYLFPGLSGPEMIDVSHWLGALITNAEIIGTLGVTPVRALIDRAAALVPTPTRAICVVTATDGGLHSVSVGDPREAWASAAEVSAASHIRYLDAPFETVLSLIPPRYDDLWTAAKGFYKVEPIVADGGRVILWAPHLREITPMHPGVEEIGYHCRDYFVGQWEHFEDRPWGELAHSTHLRGAGSWDPVLGERARVTVTLAGGVSEARTRAVGLDWEDPASIDPTAFEADPSCLVVPDAGEVLYRLRDAPRSGR